MNLIDAIKLLLSRKFKIEYIGYQSDYGNSSQRFYNLVYPKSRGTVHKATIKASTAALKSIAKAELRMKQDEVGCLLGAFV